MECSIFHMNRNDVSTSAATGPLKRKRGTIHSEPPSAYEAVSYVWGSACHRAVIRIDGKDVKVTQNLAAALRRLAFPNRSRILWVDQLCINQEDDLEKATQVPLMSQIYSRAKHCLIWLGEIDPGIPTVNVETALELLRYMNDYDSKRTTTWAVPHVLTSE